MDVADKGQVLYVLGMMLSGVGVIWLRSSGGGGQTRRWYRFGSNWSNEISNGWGMLGLKNDGRVGLQGNWNERLKETAREEPQEDCFVGRIEYN